MNLDINLESLMSPGKLTRAGSVVSGTKFSIIPKKKNR